MSLNKPEFIKIKIFKDIDYDLENNETFIGEYLSQKQIDVHEDASRYLILDILEKNKQNIQDMQFHLQMGSYITNIDYYILEQELTKEEQDLCVDIYNQYISIQKTTNYIIYGRKYSNIPKFFESDKIHNYPQYNCIDTHNFTEKDIPKDLIKAELWLIENYPDYYFGSFIEQKCKNGNFAAIAVPGYYEMIYQTTDRKAILKKIKEQLIEQIKEKESFNNQIESEIEL